MVSWIVALLLVCAYAENIISWGDNYYGSGGQSSDNTTLSANFVSTTATFLATDTVVSVFSGYTSRILTDSNKIFSMGCGPLAINSVNPSSSTIPLQVVDGNNVMSGKTFSAVSSQSNVVYIAATDGSLFVAGILYQGYPTNYAPVLVDPFLPENQYIKYLHSAQSATFLISNNGTMYGFGMGSNLRFGDGTYGYYFTTPTITSGNITWDKVATGVKHTIGIDTSGLVYTWGVKENSNLGVAGADGLQVFTPSLISYSDGDLVSSQIVVDVACGRYHTVLLTNDGRGYGFGYNNFGQICSNSDFTDLVDFAKSFDQTKFNGKFLVKAAAGEDFSLVLTSAGEIYACGSRENNAFGDGNTVNSGRIFGERLSHIDTVYNVTNIIASGFQRGPVIAFVTPRNEPSPTPSPTTTAPPLTSEPTTTASPTTVSPTTTTIPTSTTITPTTTATPTSTTSVTTTATPTTTTPTTTKAQTTTATPTTTNLLSTTATPTSTSESTTSSPTTSSPKSTTPTTTQASTTTASPTVSPTLPATTTTTTKDPVTFGPTSEPVVVTIQPVVSTTVTGNATAVPPSDKPDAVVLFATGDGKTISQVTLKPPPYTVSGRVSSATLSFEVVSLSAPVTIEIVAIDANLYVVGRITVQASKTGTIPVDISSFFSSLRRGRQVIINGKAISFTMNVLTPDVPVSVAKTSTVSLNVVTQVTEKPSISVASPLYSTAFLSFVVLALLHIN